MTFSGKARRRRASLLALLRTALPHRGITMTFRLSQVLFGMFAATLFVLDLPPRCACRRQHAAGGI